MGRRLLSLSLILILFSSTLVLLAQPNSGLLQQESNNLHQASPGNQQVGGYHIATGDWWEPSRPFTTGVNDWDGDGTLNSQDDHPLDPAIPYSGLLSGNSCPAGRAHCRENVNPAPYSETPIQILAGGSAASAVEWADVDSDGDLDLAVGNIGAQNNIYLNNGLTLESTPAWSSIDSLVTMDLAWGDMDGDGDLDLAVANYEGAAQIFRNDAGTLTSYSVWNYLHGGTSTSSRIISIAWGDVDADGDLDLAISIMLEGVRMFRNLGSSFPSSPYWSGGSSSGPYAIELADMDGDGDLDLVEGVAGGVNSYYKNSGGSFPSTPHWQSQDSNSTSSLAVGDVDGDGDMDLVVGNHGEPNQLYLNNGATLSTSPDWTSPQSSDSMDVRLADVDFDGDLDLLESNAQQQDYVRTFADGKYGDDPIWESSNSGDSGDSAFGDIDGDGDLDIATADGNDGPFLFLNGGYMLEANAGWNDGLASYTYGIDLADFDSDGDLDLVVGNAYSSTTVLEFDSGNFNQLWSSSATYYSRDVLWFDYDDDGYLDILIGDYDNRNRGFAYSPASGTFVGGGSAWTSQDFDDTQSLVSGDINGDGYDDLVSINDGTNRLNMMTSTGNSNYQLSSGSAWSSSDSVDSMCGELGDVDSDGDLDLIVANYDDPAQVFYNIGSGFQTTAGWTSSISTYGQGCDLGDVDGDGDLDLVVSNENQPNNLYLNNGGNFPTSPSWSTPQSEDTVSIGLWDVDGDGDLDWVEGNYGHKNRIRINEAGTFQNSVWFSPDLLDTWVVKMGDVDSDGDLDLVVANEQQNNQLVFGSSDQDGDWVSEPGDEMAQDPTQVTDSDGDGHGDRALGWQPDDCTGYWGDSWRDRWGCPDLDQDGQSDLYDQFMQKVTQWSDIDSDGMGDNWADASLTANRTLRGLGEWIDSAFLPDPSPWDYDNDGYEDANLASLGALTPYDDCPLQDGTSHEDVYGCRDTDRDGWSDGGDSHPGDATQHSDADGDGYGDNLLGSNPDLYPQDPTQHSDSDGDGYGDNSNGTNGDQFPMDRSQWNDSDGDGYGDSSKGNLPDACPLVFGESTEDRYGCPDSDEDGWSDGQDISPDDSAVWSDDDGDGFNDQLLDDCVGEKGSSLHDRQGCADSDRDGYSDPSVDWLAHPVGQADAFPDDNTQWNDSDDDGYGDDESGNTPDSCPLITGQSTLKLDPTGALIEWYGCLDGDGDGLQDLDDECPLSAGTSSIDRWGCPDNDGDGVSDAADDCDLQPGDSTIGYVGCPDTDGDGIPDSIDPVSDDSNGTLTDWDGDGWPNPLDSDNPFPTEDFFPADPSQWSDRDGDGLGDNPNGTSPDPYPGDKDNDAVPDLEDHFPDDPKEWLDSDGDGIGDNADSDDDNDGYADVVELRDGTDPLNPASHTIEGWELVIGGIGLGAWDMVGIFAGVPITLWLMFGLLTRNSRCNRFEDELKEANTRAGLEEIANRYEFALMVRLIGPHQGIRLERQRAEYDDVLENLAVVLDEPLTSMDQTSHVETGMKVPPPLASVGPPIGATGAVDAEGYEWIEHDGNKWYRASRDADWSIWQG